MMEFANSRRAFALFPAIPSYSHERARPKLGVSTILLLYLIISNLAFYQLNDDVFSSLVLATPSAAMDICKLHQSDLILH